MKRKELVRKIAKRTGYKVVDSEVFVAAYEEVIKETLSSGESIELHNFMKLTTKDVSGRIGINPQTKEPVTISPYRKVSIRALKGLKDCVADV